ncbi:hypothetical protein DHB64_07940 [Antarcticibacterium sp. W02-3]|nr:hypothetical protein [Antarcticibacterium sp. W02-3]
MGNLHSQVIPLDPATVTFQKVKTSSNLGNVTIEVKENYANYFSKDPIKFIEENFSLASLDLDEYEEIEVKFISNKGFLLATYDANGELKDTFQKFRDITLPRAVWSEIYNDNIGWSMAGNLYIASGTKNNLENQKYKVKLVNGKEVKRVKFIPGETRDGRVVSN